MHARILLIALGGAAAFAPLPTARVSFRNVATFYTNEQYLEALAEAKSASASFGASSPEAAVAWESVAEIESSDRTASATKSALDHECQFADAAKLEECKKFDAKLKEMEQLLSTSKAVVSQMRESSQTLQASMPKLKREWGAIDESVYEKAVAYAKSLPKGSPEANVAWSEVEDIESSSTTVARAGSLEEECIISASEACKQFEESMDELRKVIATKSN